MNAIEVEGLTKRFGQFAAVDGISFDVKKGEIFGLLGPNGAGKTTTIKCLLTLSEPTSGTARVGGIDVQEHPAQVREHCGYVPQGVSADGDLTGYENLLFYAKLFYIPRAVRKKRIWEVLDYMQLADRAHDLVKTYSGGMMRRLEVGQALLNQPGALFLDEPSIGLDPVAKRVIWDHVTRLRDELGIAVLITTHDMYEADQLCDRIAIMNGGKITVIGSPADLKAALGGDILSISSFAPDCANVLQQLGYPLLAQPSDGICEFAVKEGETEIPRVLEKLAARGVRTEAVSLKQATLDDVFLKHAGKRIGEGEEAWRDTRAMRRAIRRLAR
ncbi:MAG: ABC transporter ATP-binding protein [Dehalococcoidia bacterium]|nr:ABC transporter ATP-binding protein [Dehalococcoidia bacterium]